MGGGDLNLKKSWHPLTMRNLEKVWKAEEEAKKEELKLEELKKEKRRERELEELQRIQEQSGLGKKREERLDWMYSGVVTSAKSLQEDYLLGRRRIGDVAIIPVQREAVKQPDHSDVISRDMEQKLREDPLFEIRKQEYELTRSIIENPVHYKRIKAGARLADVLGTGRERSPPSRRSDADSRAPYERRREERRDYDNDDIDRRRRRDDDRDYRRRR